MLIRAAVPSFSCLYFSVSLTMRSIETDLVVGDGDKVHLAGRLAVRRDV